MSDRPGQRDESLRGAVFLDRDGVLNEDVGYVGQIERFVWRRGSREAVRLLNDRGLFVFVVTNQSGVARGFFTESDVKAVHDHIQASLAEIGAHIDDFRFCPYFAGGSVEIYARESSWRKPNPGMILDLLDHWPVDPARSVMIGDSDSDVLAGTRSGLSSCKIGRDDDLREVLARHFRWPATPA